MEFDIHKVKNIAEVFKEREAQEYIDDGWTLLAVCPVSDGIRSDRCYVLGSCETFEQTVLDPKAKETLSRLSGFMKNN